MVDFDFDICGVSVSAQTNSGDAKPCRCAWRRTRIPCSTFLELDDLCTSQTVEALKRRTWAHKHGLAFLHPTECCQWSCQDLPRARRRERAPVVRPGKMEKKLYCQRQNRTRHSGTHEPEKDMVGAKSATMPHDLRRWQTTCHDFRQMKR